jgi:hypothetical protein
VGKQEIKEQLCFIGVTGHPAPPLHQAHVITTRPMPSRKSRALRKTVATSPITPEQTYALKNVWAGNAGSSG